MQHPNSETITLSDILITQKLSQRTSRAPDLQAENQAMRMLIHQVTQDTASLMQTLVDTALELCQAGTTGLSLLETTADGAEIFRWNALAGALAHHVGGSTPRNFSPCDVCLEQGSPVLFSHPERYFTCFQEANTPVVEGLVLPLVADNHVFGTIWIMSHDEQRQFDSEDVRIMTSLADFTATALLLQQRQTGELLAANAVLETEIVERKQVEAQTHALIANLPGGAVFVVDRALRYLLAEGEALSAAGFKPEDFVGRTIFEVLPPELVASYEPLYRRALANEPFEHEHDAHNHTYLSRGTPLRSPNGEIYAVLAVSYDITDRKQAEEALHESEEKYRSLFNSIDEGFCVIEVLFDESGNAFDYRFLEANPAFEQQTGLVDAIGKTMRELAPQHEAHWFEIYGRIAQTGVPERFENAAEELGRFYDVYAFRTGEPRERKVAILFNDISERRQSEQELTKTNQLLQATFDNSLQIIQLFKAVRDDRGDIVDFEWLLTNKQWNDQWGRMAGKRLLTENPAVVETGLFEMFKQVTESGVPITHEHHYAYEQFDGWFWQTIAQVEDGFLLSTLDITDRKQAEIALRRSEAKYRTLFNAMEEGFCSVEVVYDEGGQPVDHRVLEANPAFERHTGLTNVQGKLASEAMPGIERFWSELYARVVATGKSERLEQYSSAFDRWFDVEVSRVGDESLHRVVLIFRDITVAKHLEEERKRQEEALRESEERLRDVLNSMTEGFALLGNDFTILDVNEETLRLDGRSRDELIGRSHWDAFPGTEDSPVGESFRRVARERMSTSLEHVYCWPDGRSLWLDMRAYPTRNDGVAIFWRDVTDRKQAEAALRESEEKYRSLFETMDEGYLLSEVIFDENDKPIDIFYLEANPAAVRLAGRDFSGQRMRQIDPNYEEYWYEIYGHVALTGESVRAERYAEPHDRWFDFYAFKVGGQESRRVAAVFNDITDRKRHDANLAFLAEVSHDLARLTSIDETMNVLGEKIGGHFNVSACVFAELSETAETAVINYTWQLSHMPSFVGTYRMQDFVAPEVLQLCRAGEAVVIRDVFADPLVDGEQYAALNIGSFLSIPLIRDGEWRFLLVIYHSEPHDWRDDEVELTYELANRIWTRLERARAEESLTRSEAKYRSLFDSMDEGVSTIEVIFDDNDQAVDFLYLENNQALTRLTGLTSAINGKRASEVLPDLEAVWLELYERVVRTGTPERVEHFVAVLDRWFDVFVSRVGGADSHTIVVLYNNITDRKRLEQRQAYMLQLSDALRSLSDAVEIQATVTCTAMNFFGADRCYYCEIIDGDVIIRQDAARENLPSVVGVYRLNDSPIFKAMLAAGQPFVFEDVHTTNVLDENLVQICLQLQIIAGMNVPVIKEGEPVGILCLAQSTPRNWTEFEIDLMEEIADRTWATIERTRAEAELRESEIQRIQEQSAHEQERQRAESLAELDRAKTRFFSNISHEFRTPLTLSLAPLQDALSDRAHPLDPVQQERLELVHRNSLRLLKLVNTLLDFSRIEAGRMEAVYEPTDLATFTIELTSVFRSAIERAGLQLIVDCPPLPEPVYVDREMWEKIVLNLLSNAFKFTFEGEIRVNLYSTDRNQAILQVQDTGTGIASEHLPHLFERFYQVQGTQARIQDGSGIGLALVHELVRLQGGTIEVSSAVGEGTRFTIALTFGTAHLPSDRLQDEGDRQPVRTLTSTAMGANTYVEEAERWLPTDNNREQTIENVEEQAAQNSDASLPNPTFARVLLVDDNADMRKYLARILSEHVQVEAVADGATALAVAQERVPDLIVSDVMMPGLNGFEFLGALRADPRTREIPIILLSARAGEEAIVEGLEAGADDYLIKPFSAQELVSRVAAHLQMAQLRGEALQAARSTIRSRDEFISVVSHELTTPLVSILGWTRMLRSRPPNPVMLSKALDTIERNATLQGKLVQDLLDLSRLSAGKLRLRLQPIELKPVIETAIATVTQTAADKGVSLSWQGNGTESVVVMGDSDRLSQVLINLLANAIKFTPESGSVRVELSIINDDDSADGSYVEIRVIDTGIGIAADFLPYVFERFRQAEGVDSVKGLGLGLAIARHLVELHNGTIHAHSAGEGRGATFSATLPLLRNDETHFQKRLSQEE